MPERASDLFDLPPYQVTRLTGENLAGLQKFLERCPDYFELVEGRAVRPREAADLLADCPPGQSAADKLLLGVFDATHRLAGILDVVPDYPVQGAWFIGLLLLDPAFRSRGLGQRLYGAFEAWAARSGASRIDLGVVEANTGAARFWTRRGFRRIERRPPRRFGFREHVVEIWRRETQAD
jgi:GNAT superfamily N-acetyltransferase